MDVDPLFLEILAGFVPEAEELYNEIARDILQLERSADNPRAVADTYQSLARGLHTLKGTSATLGLDDLSAIAQGMEDVVSPLHKRLAPLPHQVADALLKILDQFLARL